MNAPQRMSLIETPRLSKTRRVAVYVIGVGVWISGAAWLVLHYFMQQQGMFGPEPHPFEWWTLAAHGAFAFGALWLFGLLWGTHFGAAWRSLRRRVSGVAMFAVFAWLIASGYFLYYVGSDEARSLVALVHWGVGLIAPVPFILHRFVVRR
jgi:hypothetical protein